MKAATWGLSSTTRTRTTRVTSLGSRARTRSITWARRRWPSPGVNSMPTPGSSPPRFHRTRPSIAIGSTRPGNDSAKRTALPTGSSRPVATKVPPWDRLSV
jgi:hypothetical protein